MTSLPPLGTHVTDGYRAGRRLPSPYNQDPYASYGGTPTGVDLGGVYIGTVVPLALSINNIALAQTLANASAFVLTAGNNASTITLNGSTYINLTTSAIANASGVAKIAAPSRCITFTTAANSTAFTATIRGLDNYGVNQAETLAVASNANAAATTSLCAYSAILSITASAGTTANVSVGTSDTFGLNYAAYNFDNVISAFWNNIAFAGTFTAGPNANGVPTNPLIATSGDPKGTFNTAANNGAASNGVRRLTYYLAPAGLAKPQATATTANYVGVTPFYV